MCAGVKRFVRLCRSLANADAPKVPTTQPGHDRR